MKKIIFTSMLSLSILFLCACDSDADITISENDKLKGNSIVQLEDSTTNEKLGEYIYLPVLEYQMHRTQSDHKMHYLTVLQEGNLAVIQLYDNRVVYSPNLRSFEGTFIKTKLTEKGNFHDVHLITEEEYEKEVSDK